MKLKVEYTFTLSDDDRKCLERYHRKAITRAELRQLLIDGGTVSIEEQIVQGQIWLEGDARHLDDDHVQTEMP